jgi:hypothetical protein
VEGPNLEQGWLKEEVGAFEDNGMTEQEVVVLGEASPKVLEDGRACN